MTENIDPLLNEIRQRFLDLANCSSDQNDFLSHLRSLIRWNKEPMDYIPVAKPNFPDTIPVAHAVCHPSCGVEEFIVDGSTQKCQHCGGLMFRGEVAEYRLVK